MSTILFDTVKTQAKVTDSVLVAFSGGKDSVVTLDICMRYFDRVVPFFMYQVPDMGFQERLLQFYERKYNTEIIRIPHFEVSNFMRYGTFRDADMTVPIVSITDCYNYVREETGIWWIAAGERINDSIIRRAMIKNSGSTDFKRGRFYPVSAWKKNEVMQYIKHHKLKLGEDSKQLGFSFRSLDGRTLKAVKDTFPEDYEKILRLYPLADAGLLRYEYYGN